MKRSAIAACAVIVFFSAAAADLGLRSRSALKEARRHEAWSGDPLSKTAHYDAIYREELAKVNVELSSGAIDKNTAARRADRLRAEKDLHLSESSAKLSWIWYRTAAENFASPLNPWAARARERLPAAKEAWRAELAKKNLKAEDWMIE